MTEPNHDQIRAGVRDAYASIARTENGSSCSPGCCGELGAGASLALGYSQDDLNAVPEGANMGLGCGNPQAIAAIKQGETVLDLGAGGGFDAFLAARHVGESGRVIGVDMTPEMVSRARANAAKWDASNVDFRLGEIENLPVADGTVDVILSNCVVNLSPNKKAVFQEAFRVLKPGGRLAISDILATAEVPTPVRESMSAVAGCIGGAADVGTVRELLASVGFETIVVDVREESRAFIKAWLPESGAENFVASATIEATKPGPAACCGPECC